MIDYNGDGDDGCDHDGDDSDYDDDNVHGRAAAAVGFLH
jgi:hypothetical protein